MTSSSQPTSKADLDLWKFFEDRGSKLKESLFNTVSWVLGFSAAVLGARFILYIGLDSAEDAAKALTILQRA